MPAPPNSSGDVAAKRAEMYDLTGQALSCLTLLRIPTTPLHEKISAFTKGMELLHSVEKIYDSDSTQKNVRDLQYNALLIRAKFYITFSDLAHAQGHATQRDELLLQAEGAYQNAEATRPHGIAILDKRARLRIRQARYQNNSTIARTFLAEAERFLKRAHNDPEIHKNTYCTAGDFFLTMALAWPDQKSEYMALAGVAFSHAKQKSRTVRPRIERICIRHFGHSKFLVR